MALTHFDHWITMDNHLVRVSASYIQLSYL